MSWTDAFSEFDRTIARRHELLAAGATGRSLTAAVASGRLVRVMRDHYALPGTPETIIRAVRVGGRACCTSALALGGIFVFENRGVHVHLQHQSSRLRSPSSRDTPLPRGAQSGVTLHWSRLLDAVDGTEFAVGVLDALVQGFACQEPWHAIASVDNALHLGAIRESDVPILFDALPRRFDKYRVLVDGRSESGQETILRLMLQSAGIDFEIQVEIEGVGRVDFVVEGVLVVEADSRQAHDGWELHVRDRGRDLTLAARHYMSLRPAYQHTMHQPASVLSAIQGLLTLHSHFRRSL